MGWMIAGYNVETRSRELWLLREVTSSLRPGR